MNDVTFIRLAPGDVKIVAGGNPRQINEESAEFAELLASVAAQGVIVPIHVRKVDARYELLAGERRLRAAVKAGLADIPVIDHGEIGDAEAFEITFAENFAREDLTVIEQGRAAAFMLERYKGDAQAAASKMGKTVRWLMQRAALATRLSKKWLAALNDGEQISLWTASHLQLVAALPAEMQDALLEDIGYGDPPSVKDLEEMITGSFNYLARAPWVAGKHGCSACKKRSACRPGLWDDTTDEEQVKKNDRCLDPACWSEKMRTHLKEKFAEAKKDHPNIVAAVLPGEYCDYYKTKEIVEDYGEPWSNWKAAKEGGKGALPAMIVSGTKAGDIRWIRPADKSRDEGSVPKKKDSTEPASLDQRRDRLNRKRWNEVLRELREKVEVTAETDLTFANPAAGIMAMAAVYGNVALSLADILDEDRAEEGLSCEPEIVIIATGEDKERGLDIAIQLLWRSVKPTLRKMLTNPAGVTQMPDSCISFAKWIAPVIGVDMDALFAEICGRKGFTEPKSWKKERGINHEGNEET